MRKVWARCPPETLIFPGHEYTSDLLRERLSDPFTGDGGGGGGGVVLLRGADLEAGGEVGLADELTVPGGVDEPARLRHWQSERSRLWKLMLAYHRAQAFRAVGLPTVPTTLADEYGYNSSFGELHSAAAVIQHGWARYVTADEAAEAAERQQLKTVQPQPQPPPLPPPVKLAAGASEPPVVYWAPPPPPSLPTEQGYHSSLAVGVDNPMHLPSAATPNRSIRMRPTRFAFAGAAADGCPLWGGRPSGG